MEAPILNRQVGKAPYDYPLKAIQIGEGNFIRGFVDWMIDQCNRQGLFCGSIVATQPRIQGASKLEKLKEQDGLFTLLERGLVNGREMERIQVVASIAKTIDPYKEWESFLALADNPDIEFVFSNTTEAGIIYTPEQGDFSLPIHSYPGKLTALLYRRFQQVKVNKQYQGMVIIPCELVERAGDRVREIVLQHATDWNLGEDFTQWIVQENLFINSIVDRIVTGYPHDEAEQLTEKLGYQDRLLTVTEPYYLWILEGTEELAERLPLHKAGLAVKWVDDLSPYIKRKVRILNGAHTFMFPIAYLKGYDLVRDAIQDPAIYQEIYSFLINWVTPTLSFSRSEIEEYIQQTFERFRNPYLKHRLLDIAMNSTSKFCTRLLPTLVESIETRDEIPHDLLKSLAYLIRFYRCVQDEEGKCWGWRVTEGTQEGYQLKDSDQVLRAFSRYWNQYEQDQDMDSLIKNILSSEAIWPTPLAHCTHTSFSEICRYTGQQLSVLLEEMVDAETIKGRKKNESF